MTAKERVEQEIRELNERMDNLAKFLYVHNTIKENMSMEERFLLSMQLNAMIYYKLILERRLEIWREL